MVDVSTLPSDVREQVLRELGPDEQLRWFGQPRPFAFIGATIPAVLFGIPWTGFALFWTYAAAGFRIPDVSTPDPSMLFPLFGLPFILIGLGMLSSPLWVVRRASRTAYLITNKRAVVMDGGGKRTITSVTPDRFGAIVRRETRSGRGDIVFSGGPVVAAAQEDYTGAAAHTGSARQMADYARRFAAVTARSRTGGAMEPAFLDIENPRQVEELLRSMGGSSW